MSKTINVHVRLDARAFQRFCNFDTFRRQRRWYAPAMAGMLLITASSVLMAAGQGRYSSLAGVLMGLGLAVPAMVFGLYYIQIRVQIARMGLKDVPAVYSLCLSREGVRVTNDQKQEDPVDLEWEQLWGAFKRPDCVYLYVNPQRAFILPDGQADASPEALWQYLVKHMGKERCIDKK